jgi:hypothetical protein
MTTPCLVTTLERSVSIAEFNAGASVHDFGKVLVEFA